MNNVDRARIEKNREKEIARKEPYELIRMDNERFKNADEKIKEFMFRMLEEIEKSKMSYLEVNEAMYHIDALLRERSLKVPIVFKSGRGEINKDD